MHPHVSPTMASQAPWVMQLLNDQAKLCSHLHWYPVVFDEHTAWRGQQDMTSLTFNYMFTGMVRTFQSCHKELSFWTKEVVPPSVAQIFLDLNLKLFHNQLKFLVVRSPLANNEEAKWKGLITCCGFNAGDFNSAVDLKRQTKIVQERLDALQVRDVNNHLEFIVRGIWGSWEDIRQYPC